MPDALERRLLLMILGNTTISSGRLRIEREDFMAMASGGYDQGAQMPAEETLFTE